MIETIAITFLIFSLSSMSIVGVSISKIKKIDAPIFNPLLLNSLGRPGRSPGARRAANKKINEIQEKTAATTGSIEILPKLIKIPDPEDKRAEL